MAYKVKNVRINNKELDDNGMHLHWKKFSSTGNAFLCAKSDCFEYPTTGAHVVRLDGDDKETKIIPLCGSCSGLKNEFEVDHSTEFVSINAGIKEDK